MIDFVRINEDRMKILKNDEKLIGKLEKFADVKIELNEDVTIESEDPLKILRVKQIIQAFGRGFDFEDALDLLDEDYCLEIIEIKDFSGKSRNRMMTLKGRMIGTEGKTKKLIEKYSECKISVYGKTICIIGKWDKVRIAREAIEMILSGSLHNTVYRFLERQKG